MTDDLKFHDVAGDDEATAPAPAPAPRRRQRAQPEADACAQPQADEVWAQDCVLNSQCTLTDGCRGKLVATNAAWGKRVQVYCNSCRKFAKGTRPLHGMFNSRTFDRRTGKHG